MANYSQQLLKRLLDRPPQSCGLDIYTLDWLAVKYYKEKEHKEPEFPSDEGLILLQEGRFNLTQGESKSLEKLTDEYLLEEITAVIESRGIKTLEFYLKEDRFGRKLGLKDRQRCAIWRLYELWKQILQASGYVSKGQMRLIALEKASQATEKPYQSVIVDEAQDLSPIALRFLAELVSNPNGLYLTADTSQSIYQRGFSWDYLQGYLKFRGKTKVLRQSYRSTQQISRGCKTIIKGTQAGDEDSLLYSPSNLNGDRPILFLSDSHDQRSKRIQTFLQDSAQKHKLPINSGAVLVPNADYGQIIARQLSTEGLKAKFIDSADLNLLLPDVKVLTLQASKGLEFPFVIIAGLQKGRLPDLSGAPNDEVEEAFKQQLRLFYVGCSRAMRSLLVCGSRHSPSEFLINLRNSSDWKIEEA